MTDIAGITAVRPTERTQYRHILYGATISAGNCVTMVDAEGVLSDADASAALAGVEGIAITPGVDSGYGLIANRGSIILVGATMTVGTVYIASDTPGGIKPMSDAESGDWVTIIGTASTTTQLDLSITRTAVQVP